MYRSIFQSHGAYGVWIDQTTATLKIAGIAGIAGQLIGGVIFPKTQNARRKKKQYLPMDAVKRLN